MCVWIALLAQVRFWVWIVKRTELNCFVVQQNIFLHFRITVTTSSIDETANNWTPEIPFENVRYPP